MGMAVNHQRQSEESALPRGHDSMTENIQNCLCVQLKTWKSKSLGYNTVKHTTIVFSSLSTLSTVINVLHKEMKANKDN